MTAATSGAIVGASTPGSRSRWVAWSSVVLYIALAGTSLVFESRFVGQVTLVDIWSLVAILGCAVIGALIVSTHQSHPIGWMFCGAAVSLGFSFFAREYAVQALVVAPGTIPFGQAMAWFGFWADMPGIAVLALFLPLLFPDGRLPSPRWKPAAYFAAVNFVLAVGLTMVAPATYAHAGYPSIRNPIGLDQYAGFFDAIGQVLEPLLLVLVVVSVLALFDRVRRAGDEERHQIKWFAFAGALLLLSFLMQAASRFVPLLAGPSELIASLALAALPAAVGIAILRHRLYDIDLIINRTVVYVLLTATLGGLYTASLALFQRLFVATTGQGSDLAIVMTLFVLATVFTPIKNTLQEKVDHRIKPAHAGARPAGSRAGIDDLLMLADLHRNGILTDEEFAAKKKQVLGL
jgi:putative oligomerization/nucleic acid binding protein